MSYFKPLVAACLLIVSTVYQLEAQTKGLIIKKAGTSVLDPNGDGYASLSSTGFVLDDETESEVPFVRISVPNIEPTSDLLTSGSCGFTDFVDNGSKYPAAMYVDASNNLMFRFRMGNYATNSKGYSVLIDTDGKFGNSGTQADPNYTTANPGFEVEVELVTNFGVRLYNVDGASGSGITLMETLPWADYAQISIALTNACGDADYFYEFYVPYSKLTTHFGITTSTALRMMANTVSSTQSALTPAVSDVGGVNGNNYGTAADQWIFSILQQYPVTGDNIKNGDDFPPLRAAAPVVNNSIGVGATSVSGTSSEPNGSTITVYKNGVSVGTATVSGGTWTLSGLSALAAGDIITATASTTGKSVSLLSSPVTVSSVRSDAPTLSCVAGKGIEGNGVTAPIGSTIRIYKDGVLIATTTTTTSAGNFVYNCTGGTSCSSGGAPCMGSGNYWATAQEPNETESLPSAIICYQSGGGSTTTTTPVISTSPITPNTTSISGTAVSGARVILYVNSAIIAQTTATGGNYTFSSLSFTLGQAIEVKAIDGTKCISNGATSSVTQQTLAPVVLDPLINSATSISGTSTEDSGTVITIYKNGSSIGTATVNRFRRWSLTGLTPALVTGNTVYATALATGKTLSANSSTVTVQGATTNIPVITGTYYEGGTSVSGTSASANGTVIKVYIDGTLLGSTTVSGGNWSLTGLSSAAYDLYTGGQLTATATETSRAESNPSSAVTVNCNTPATNLAVNAQNNPICQGTNAAIEVHGTEQGVIYTLRNAANTADMGASALGNGGTIVLTSFAINTAQTLKILASKLPNTSCSGINSNDVAMTLNPNPINSLTLSSDSTAVVVPTNSANIFVANSQSGIRYQLRRGNTVLSTRTGTGGTISLNTGAVTATTTYNVLATDTTQTTQCSQQQTQTITIYNYVVTLPVSWLDVTATVQQKAVVIQWSTASEDNNSHFVIERSTNLKDWSPIGAMKAAGNSQQLKNYAFTDETPLLETVNYYRIQQVDFNGMSDYSKVVSAKPVAEEQTAVIFPNPADQYVQIQVPFHEAVISIALVNPEGKAIEAPAFAIYPGMLRISVGHVADGNYMVRIVTAHKIYAQKLAIKH